MSAQLPAVAQKALEVLVQNQQAVAVPGLRVSIQNSDFFTTDQQGKFKLPLANGLRMPIRAELEDERWEVVKAAHYEDQGRLVVFVNRLIQLNEVATIQVADTIGQPVANLQVKLEGATYVTDAAGRIKLPSPQSAYAHLQLVGSYQLFNRQAQTSSHTLILTVHEKAPQVVEIARPGNDPLVKAYEEDFERITVQIGNDRALYEQKNEEIRKEILKIQDKLLNENEITEPQREELRGYLSGLEKNLEENSQAIRLTEARTREALSKLKDLLVEKDSINRIALGRIQRIEAEKAAAEAGFRQKMIIFAGIILALIAGLGIVYFFAVTYRRQKLWLKEINRQLKYAQDDLTYSLRELNQKKAQIEDHNQQLEVFVYKASHDIKGPLRSIMGLTQIGLSDVKDNTALEYFQHIYKSTRRLDNLLMDLLKLTKVKQAEVDRQPIDLPAMLQNIIQSFSNIRYFDQVQISLDIQEGIALESDEKLLYSVLQNFVENGIKYCDPYKAQPMLQISVAQNAQETTFTFKDNGLGISQDQLPKIFDMFYKVDPSSDGTGLGLHIVKLTIEKLGGRLRVRSRERQGSTFILTFAQ
ncbi:MAG: HAMP domain-containing histidine kinase [Bacteroidetes bacterium]|nr:HAMP domain-containing histidine kinase [Bacteroidota bacterium]